MTATTESRGIWTTAFRLSLGGAAGFWVTNFAISLTPIAAEYRAVLGIPYLPMLGEALLGGLIVGLAVSFGLLRFYGKLPTTSPMLMAVVLSLIALIVATVLVEIPPRLLMTTNTAPRYILIGAAFNTLRFLALGVAIGYLHGRPAGPKRPTAQKTDSGKPPT
jgi:hypothetical protein